MDGAQWETVDVAKFWQLADELQERTIDHARNLFTYAESAEPKQLLSLLIQYRFFTIYYIPDIAMLIARLHDGRLRSFLAGILSDELGCGDPLQAHPRLYDDFLASIGAGDQDLDQLAIPDNIRLLEDVRRKLSDPSRSTAYGIGLRGMGGECVCQIYLSRFYEHIIKNPYIRERHGQIDWRFWDLHVGEHDIAHRLQTRKLIQEEVLAQGPSAARELGEGYYESMVSWSQFWENVFASVAKPISQFHLAIPVRNLEEARRFYRDVLGAKEGRSTANFIDFNFYGHHLVLHQAPREATQLFETFRSAFHGETVQIPHFGMNLDWQAWSELADLIKSQRYEFFDPPHIRMKGLPGEHATMFVVDPSGNALEFKAFRNHDEVFSKVFDPRTKDVFGLETLTAEAR